MSTKKDNGPNQEPWGIGEIKGQPSRVVSSYSYS